MSSESLFSAQVWRAQLLETPRNFEPTGRSIMIASIASPLSRALLAIALVAGLAGSAAAAQGDPAGWQYRIEKTDGGEHQFLVYVARQNGPRALTLGCERDIDTFAIYAEDLSELVGPVSHATMMLSSGPATFTIPGITEPDPETQVLGFVSEIPLSGGGFQQLARTIPPLLSSGKPITIRFGTRTRELPPVTGFLDPAGRFMRACFAGQG